MRREGKMLCLRVAVAGLCLIALPFTSFALPFSDVTRKAGVGNVGNGKGVAWADIDRDGYQDLFVSNKGGRSILYRNNGNGTFTDITGKAGLADVANGYSMGSSFADYDNDGFPDLYIVKGGREEIESNRLMHNNGNGTFTDVTDKAGVGAKMFTYAAAWADYDRDGFLDLYLANYGVGKKNILYRNNGNGTFTDVTDKAGVGDRSWSWSAVWSDVNNDGWPDLYVVNGEYPTGQKNKLYLNNGDGTFRDFSRESGADDPNWGLGAAFADYDNDGNLDLYISNYVGPNRLLHNDGKGHFTDVSTPAGLAYEGWGKGPSWGDVNNDGSIDLYEGDCKLANQLYINNGKGKFTNQAKKFPVVKNQGVRTKGTAFCDIDNDGDLDLFVVSWGGANKLYRNEQKGKNFLEVKLTGTVSNRDAVGARVKVSQNGKQIGLREVVNFSGFCSQPPLVQHFGLPKPGKYTVDVTWPNGKKSSGTYQSGQIITIVEGK
jgi:hypothetical protein